MNDTCKQALDAVGEQAGANVDGAMVEDVRAWSLSVVAELVGIPLDEIEVSCVYSTVLDRGLLSITNPGHFFLEADAGPQHSPELAAPA